MKTKRFTGLFIAAIMLAASFSFAGVSSAEELTQIDVVLDWYPNAIHTFLYEAIENGYFEEEGLSVNLINPADSVDAINFVAAGRAQIGLTYPVDVIQSQTAGMPVISIASVSQKALDCMCSLASNTITDDMSTLKGKTIGIAGHAVSQAVVDTVAAYAGLEKGDFEVLNVGFDLITSLTTGNADLVVGTFINDEIVTMQNAGFDINVYMEQDYGVPELYGLIMAVNSDDYASRPEVYAGFLRACKKGFEDMKSDEDAALELIMSKMNSDDNPLDEVQQRQSYEILLPKMEPEGSPFMSMDAETWQEVIDWMTATGQIEESIDASSVMLVPEI